MHCFRVWFTSGNACLVDARDERDARTEARRLYPKDKIESVEKLIGRK